ncbi:MAG TPA: AAA family ATPase, partial [Burkholderiaceae bacterium]|nr:AAA family ATPase [Burkholderiaceae bacterium]
MTPLPEIRFGGRYVLRSAQGQLLADGRLIALGGRAFDVLCKLAERAGQTVSKRELMDRVWPDSVVEENNLQVQISALRRVLGPGAIVTIAGRGYRLGLAVDDEQRALSPAPTAIAGLSGMPRRVPGLKASSQTPGTVLLEREEPLRRLASALAKARGGHGSVCLVSGEAGIGKTALCEAFVAGLDLRVLRGACEIFFSPRPLGAVHDFAAELDPGLVSLLRQEGPHVEVFARTLRLLETQPTVLWFDDLQWADTATLDFVKYLGRRIRKCPVLLLLTYRDDELSEGHPLLLVLGDLQGSVSRLTLQPLSETAVEKLARDAGRSAEGVLAATGGNPFEVTELLKTGGLPETVRDAVLTRVAKQAPAVQALLQLVAIVPRRVEHWIVQELLDCDSATISKALSCGLLVSDGVAMAFRHELDRQLV